MGIHGIYIFSLEIHAMLVTGISNVAQQINPHISAYFLVWGTRPIFSVIAHMLGQSLTFGKVTSVATSTTI